MPKTHNLFLVHHLHGQKRQDFDEISAKVESLAPGIAVHIVPHDADASACDLPRDVWTRPSLAVSFRWPERFRLRRGLLYAGRPINKFLQARKYAAARIAIPKTLAYEFGRPLNRAFWGEHVIMKPTRIDMMSHGHFIFLMRTDRVGELAQKIFPPDHPARQLPVLIQQFIDTGEYPESYRVLTLFGEPLYCMTFRQDRPRSALTGSDRELLSLPIASNAGENYVHALIDDKEVMAFARRRRPRHARDPASGHRHHPRGGHRPPLRAGKQFRRQHLALLVAHVSGGQPEDHPRATHRSVRAPSTSPRKFWPRERCARRANRNS